MTNRIEKQYSEQMTREYFAYCIKCGHGVYKEDALLMFSSIGLEQLNRIQSILVYDGLFVDENYFVYHKKCHNDGGVI